MGLAASQARLLSLTARIHDVEYQAQMIQSAKLKLALQEDDILKKYNDALDAQTLTYSVGNNVVAADFNNLFGISSFTNGLSTAYTLWDKDDRLVVPDEIADAYAALAGKTGVLDPYAFAMYMMTGKSIEEINTTETEYIQGLNANEALPDVINTKREAVENLIKDSIYAIYDNHTNGSQYKDETMNGMTEAALNGDWENLYQRYFSTFELSKEEKTTLDSLKTAMDEYRFQVYSKRGEQIYRAAIGDDNAKFDSNVFNGYLRYAQLIAREQGIDYCTRESDYGTGFGTNRELLNDLLMSGKATMDIISIDRSTGKLTDNKTSASTDTNVSFTNTSKIDSTTLKKAEAEYEHAMKLIDRQDKKYDLELNRLETERNALTTEYDSVKKVISDNIERTFGIFS